MCTVAWAVYHGRTATQGCATGAWLHLHPLLIQVGNFVRYVIRHLP